MKRCEKKDYYLTIVVNIRYSPAVIKIISRSMIFSKYLPTTAERIDKISPLSLSIKR